MPAGYSGTPLGQKLGVRPGHVLALVDAPDGWWVPDLDPSVDVRQDLRRRSAVIVAFVRARRDLDRRSARLVQAVAADAALWVAWPRKAGGHASDLTEQALRDTFLPVGLVDNKVAALDDDWSGLRFVWRRERRGAMRVGS